MANFMDREELRVNIVDCVVDNPKTPDYLGKPLENQHPQKDNNRVVPYEYETEMSKLVAREEIREGSIENYGKDVAFGVYRTKAYRNGMQIATPLMKEFFEVYDVVERNGLKYIQLLLACFCQKKTLLPYIELDFFRDRENVRHFIIENFQITDRRVYRKEFLESFSNMIFVEVAKKECRKISCGWKNMGSHWAYVDESAIEFYSPSTRATRKIKPYDRCGNIVEAIEHVKEIVVKNRMSRAELGLLFYFSLYILFRDFFCEELVPCLFLTGPEQKVMRVVDGVLRYLRVGTSSRSLDEIDLSSKELDSSISANGGDVMVLRVTEVNKKTLPILSAISGGRSFNGVVIKTPIVIVLPEYYQPNLRNKIILNCENIQIDEGDIRAINEFKNQLVGIVESYEDVNFLGKFGSEQREDNWVKFISEEILLGHDGQVLASMICEGMAFGKAMERRNCSILTELFRQQVSYMIQTKKIRTIESKDIDNWNEIWHSAIIKDNMVCFTKDTLKWIFDTISYDATEANCVKKDLFLNDALYTYECQSKREYLVDISIPKMRSRISVLAVWHSFLFGN